MTTLSWDRSKRVAAASVLAVIAVVAGAVMLAVGVGVRDGWWPHTGEAFAADTAHRDPCDLLVGRAMAYCERGAPSSASGRHDVAGGAWRLLSAGAGVAALVVWRLRGAAGQRRR
ncbi:hypothetical protein [Streptomyces sp. NPDC127084]|uniref:hypothetical protein n=1 Tax=Streptomyces sp. NPDC127084 TaxID=3347133 RepID=UPI00364D4975